MNIKSQASTLVNKTSAERLLDNPTARLYISSIFKYGIKIALTKKKIKLLTNKPVSYNRVVLVVEEAQQTKADHSM